MFIQECIKRYKEKKEFAYKMECSYAITSLDTHIKDLDNAVKKASSNKIESSSKSISFKDYDRIKWFAQVVSRHYERFIRDLKEKELLYSCNMPEREKKSLKKEIDYMHNLKRQYKAEFSDIYGAYVDLVYNTDTMEMQDSNPIASDILGIMNEGFDKADINYNNKHDKPEPLIRK